MCSKLKTHTHTLHYTCLVLHSGAQTLAKLNYSNSVISCRCWDVYIFLIISNANAHICPLNVCNAEVNISVGKRPSPHLTELNLLLRKGRPHLISDLNWQYTHAIVTLEDKWILISVHIWVFAGGQKTWHLVMELLFFLILIWSCDKARLCFSPSRSFWRTSIPKSHTHTPKQKQGIFHLV